MQHVERVARLRWLYADDNGGQEMPEICDREKERCRGPTGDAAEGDGNIMGETAVRESGDRDAGGRREAQATGRWPTLIGRRNGGADA